jgi:ribosomal-protein-alanine N-acetyltransferase
MSVLAKLLRPVADATVVEPLRRRHLGGVMAIEAVSYPRPWTPAVFQSELQLAKAGQRVYLVARQGSTVVGYVGLMLMAGDGHVANIATHPDRRRQGLATLLLATVLWDAIDRRCPAVTLEVRASNTAAQRLYGRFGFVAAGVRQRYYENTEDAVVMWLHDLQSVRYRQHLAELCPEAAR